VGAVTRRVGPIRVTGQRRKCIDTRRLAEALVRITIRANAPDDGRAEPRGVIDREAIQEEKQR
jgi:hypothetical protein